MLKFLKSLLEQEEDGRRPIAGHERRHLHVAVASLLHEATRVDLAEHEEERAVGAAALADLFGLADEAARAVFEEGAARAQQLTSYFGPVSVVKRDMALAERTRLIEHLWRVAYADGELDQYEDHYVRKIGHLLYVPNTEIMLARNRARSAR
ncbi:MAG TPA: TerB family tellurite resistance protein [Burkholderiales bacterium]|jgi:uncharacterized tellurite resistance protein B-like protein|nr:TerB family tellurite resistance protein [Burkholderiales bacterium]